MRKDIVKTFKESILSFMYFPGMRNEGGRAGKKELERDFWQKRGSKRRVDFGIIT